ncbi:C-type lectin domain family 2 member D11-like [Alexandromys fortis]|uniref:C-type lectin domain family 2 member D11-like n=1 Tax=Alexandromys fortis TaxID=100897 RepID=UPI0021534BF1|nr:C-type lectin domain family 2 member D11-like [Microtus fortis]
MSAPEPAEALVRLLSTRDSPPKDDMGKKFQRKRLRIFSPMSSRLCCSYVANILLFGAVIALSLVLLFSERRPEPVSIKNANGACPRNWIGFGNKCFYFSEDTSNWTFSQNFCMELKAQLAQFDNMEELNFLKRYIGTFDYWIGLHRQSQKHTWRWMNNTEYNSAYVFKPFSFYHDRLL